LRKPAKKTWAEAREKTQAEDNEKAYRRLLESARNFKRLGLSDAQIASALGLSVEEVASA
jgi:predicted transposase YdaD